MTILNSRPWTKDEELDELIALRAFRDRVVRVFEDHHELTADNCIQFDGRIQQFAKRVGCCIGLLPCEK